MPLFYFWIPIFGKQDKRLSFIRVFWKEKDTNREYNINNKTELHFLIENTLSVLQTYGISDKMHTETESVFISSNRFDEETEQERVKGGETGCRQSESI